MEDAEEKKKVIEKALEGASAEVVNRYSSAVNEHMIAYSGKNNALGSTMKRGLKSVSEYKLNDNLIHRETNIKQQSGFSYEGKTVARRNAESIIKKNSEKYVRTDDIHSQETTDGKTIGQVNDPLFDVAKVNGSDVTGVQLKLIGRNGKECAALLLGKDYEKYVDNGVHIEIPKDYYKEAQAEFTRRIGKTKEEITKLEGELEKYPEKRELLLKKKAQLERIEKTEKLLKPGNVTSKEAIEARLHPKLSTAKEVVKLSHRAGLNQAAIGAAVSGSVSLVKNVAECIKGNIEPAEAGKNIAKDTGEGAVVSYLTAFSGTAINGVLKNSANVAARSLANTNLASGLVITSKNVGKSVSKYLKGDIEASACLNEIQEGVIGELGAAFGSTCALYISGGSMSAVTVVAGMVGSTFGYMAAIAVYKEIKTSLKEYELAVEQRIIIEKQCEEAVALITQYRKEMNEQVEKYLSDNISTFSDAFDIMDDAIISNDADGFIIGNAKIQECLGRKPQFTNQDEFDLFMNSSDDLVF